MFKKIILIITCCLALWCQDIAAQFVLNPDRTAEQLIDQLVKENVTIFNPELDCEGNSNVTYNNVEPVPYIDTAGIILGVSNIWGILEYGSGPPWSGTPATYYSTRDEDVNAIYRSWGVDTLINSGMTCKLTFYMIPKTDTVKIDYATSDANMGSIAFLSGFKQMVRSGCRPACDMFAILVSGGSENYMSQNFAVVPGTSNIPVNAYTCMLLEADSFPNCRDGLMDGWEDVPYTEYYHIIEGEYDSTHLLSHLFAISSKMEAVIPTTPCDTYFVKLAVAKGTYYYEESDFLPGTAPEGIELHGEDFLNAKTIPDFFFLSNLRGVGAVYECTPADTTTSIGIHPVYTALSIYPNPASTSIQVDLSKVKYSSGSIVIYDMTGKQVYTQSLQHRADQLQVSVKDFPSGVYTLLLHTDRGNYKGKFSIDN